MFREAFREALADDDITSILIEIDSPGGRADLVAETADEIRAARGQGKPIVAIANTLAASAAYWIASAADEVVVTTGGLVGSIGTYITHLETSKFDEDLGFTYTLISAGKYKTDGNELQPLSDSARENYQQIVEAFNDLFIAGVADGRGVDEDTVRNGYGEGHVLPPDAALAEGMVDRIETYEQTVARLIAGRGPGARSPLAAATPAATARLDAPDPAAQLEQPELPLVDDTPAPAPAVEAPTAAAAAEPPPSSPPPAEREAVTASSPPAWQLIPTSRH
jgi:signal peptide peptidase SppA